MKNKNYHAVGTVPKLPHCRNSSKITTLSEQFQNYHTVGTVPKSNLHIVETGTKSLPITHICMTGHFPGLIQPLQ
jgi:hypothetical protein